MKKKVPKIWKIDVYCQNNVTMLSHFIKSNIASFMMLFVFPKLYLHKKLRTCENKTDEIRIVNSSPITSLFNSKSTNKSVTRYGTSNIIRNRARAFARGINLT